MKSGLLLSLTLGALGFAAPIRAAAADDATAAIPGAAAMTFTGFGSDTPGGRGGRVIHVTTLDRDGEGSLKSALAATGPRIIVFEVGGIIDWQKDTVAVTAGQVTIAGETAPSPGITIIRGELSVEAPDVIVRHLRMRLGDGADLKKPNWEADCMHATGPNAHDVLFDHCSTAWSIDENLSVSGPRELNGTSHHVTIRECIIAEGLDDSTHTKGPHSKGTLIHDFVHDVAIVGNFYAHDYNRNPFLKPNTTVFMANNLIYDPVSAAIHFAWVPEEYKVINHSMDPGQLTSIANVLRMGPYTPPGLPMYTCTPGAPKGVGLLYQKDSLVYSRKGQVMWSGDSGKPGHLAEGQIKLVKEPMLWPKDFKPLPVAQTEAYVLKNAGARPKDRDSVDQRIIRDYQERKGNILDSQDEVGGYPKARPTHRKLDVPAGADAIEAWLAKYRAELEY